MTKDYNDFSVSWATGYEWRL